MNDEIEDIKMFCIGVIVACFIIVIVKLLLL